MDLGVWHSTGIEPHIDEVGLASEHIACCRHEFDIIYVWAVQVDAIVILLRHIAGDKAFLLKRIGSHHTGSHRFLYFTVKLLYTADADFLTGLGVAPNR